MSIISWRKPKIEIGKLGADGELPTVWTEVDIPVENSTKITPAKGEKKEFKEEGGGVIDVFYKANNYVIEFELYAKNGKSKPVVDVDGVIDGEYAIRITPENTAMPGKMADRVKLSCEDTLASVGDGERWKYTADVLTPASGNKIKPHPLVVATKTATK